MTRRALLLDLAARCEAALGVDREIDAAIYAALNPHMKPTPGKLGHFFDPAKTVALAAQKYHISGGATAVAARVTGSLDAALTLAPQGYALDMFSDDEGCSAMVGSPASGKAATLPLALTAAALKALAAQIGESE